MPVDDDLARFRAQAEQSKASLGDLADHLALFYNRLRETFNEAQAFELTQSWLIEITAAAHGDEDYD